MMKKMINFNIAKFPMMNIFPFFQSGFLLIFSAIVRGNQAIMDYRPIALGGGVAQSSFCSSKLSFLNMPKISFTRLNVVQNCYNQDKKLNILVIDQIYMKRDNFGSISSRVEIWGKDAMGQKKICFRTNRQKIKNCLIFSTISLLHELRR